MNETRYQRLKRILATNKEISEWYKDNHNFDISIVNPQNINLYGTGGYGDIVDMIFDDDDEQIRQDFKRCSD